MNEAPTSAPPHAVVFDFDGVIVDTEPLHYRAFQAVLEPLGLSYSWETYREVFIGFDDRDAFATSFQRAGLELPQEQLEALIKGKGEAFQVLAQVEDLQPYPGIIELVEHLSGAVWLGLCSGALKADIAPILARIGLSDAFQVMVTADLVCRSKPDPESYRLVLANLEERCRQALDPAACLAIEDTPSGILSAVEAGFRVIGITNTHSAEQLPGAFKVVESLEGVTLGGLKKWMKTN